MSGGNQRRLSGRSEAEGLEPVPLPLALGELPKRARDDLWNWLRAWKLKVRERDQSTGEPASGFTLVEAIFMTARIERVFRVVQYILRQPYGRSQLSVVRRIFRSNLLAYDILDIPPYGATIVPNATPEEGAAIQRTFGERASAPYVIARQHLRRAGQSINAGNAAKGVTEAILAVETVVRAATRNNNLDHALAALNAHQHSEKR
jgi:hypothetical protein